MKRFKIVLEAGTIHEFNNGVMGQSEMVYPEEVHECTAKKKSLALLEALDTFKHKAGGRMIRHYEMINGEYVELFFS